MFDSSFIARTGQRWKLAAPLVLMAAGGLAIHFQCFLADHLGRERTGVAVLGAALVTLLGFLFPCVGIRCPRCHGRVFWMAVSRQESSAWLGWLLSLQSCPRCGLDPEHGAHTPPGASKGSIRP